MVTVVVAVVAVVAIAIQCATELINAQVVGCIGLRLIRGAQNLLIAPCHSDTLKALVPQVKLAKILSFCYIFHSYKRIFCEG